MQFRSDRLLELRKQKRLSQEELAQCLDVSQSLVSYYESGNKQPGYETLAKIADLFAVSVEYLLGLTDNPHGTHLLDMASVNKITDTVAEAIVANPSLLKSYQDFFEREDLQLILEHLRRFKPETIQKLLEVVKLINDSKQ